ncbi:MAG: FMN-binding negative transcriptional regulator [Pseudomonadota bacterium]
MYVNQAFSIDDNAAIAMADRVGFGVVVAVPEHTTSRFPIGVHVPFVIKHRDDGARTIEFHVARANPIADCADGAIDWLLIVQGPNAYISADWYENVQQVPTWLYEAVHINGPCRQMSARDLAVHSDEVSAKFEERLLPKPPWTSDKMDPRRRDAMRKGIIGLTMRVREVTGIRKLNQTKSEAEQRLVVAALNAQGGDGPNSIAAAMTDNLAQRT